MWLSGAAEKSLQRRLCLKGWCVLLCVPADAHVMPAAACLKYGGVCVAISYRFIYVYVHCSPTLHNIYMEMRAACVYNRMFGVQVFAIHLPEWSEHVIPCVTGVNGQSRLVSHTCRAK